MTDIQHTHDESASAQTHAHNRFDGVITTRNFRLSRTSGTDTKFSLLDRRTAAEVEFDRCRVGLSMGRGDTVQFYVGEYPEEYTPWTTKMTRVGDWYQHDLDDYMIEILSHIEEHGELPSPDYVVDAEVVEGDDDD